MAPSLQRPPFHTNGGDPPGPAGPSSSRPFPEDFAWRARGRRAWPAFFARPPWAQARLDPRGVGGMAPPLAYSSGHRASVPFGHGSRISRELSFLGSIFVFSGPAATPTHLVPGLGARATRGTGMLRRKKQHPLHVTFHYPVVAAHDWIATFLKPFTARPPDPLSKTPRFFFPASTNKKAIFRTGNSRAAVGFRTAQYVFFVQHPVS